MVSIRKRESERIRKYTQRFVKRYAMFAKVGSSLGRVPFKFQHAESLIMLSQMLVDVFA